jgi:hypothetical protein
MEMSGMKKIKRALSHDCFHRYLWHKSLLIKFVVEGNIPMSTTQDNQNKLIDEIASTRRLNIKNLGEGTVEVSYEGETYTLEDKDMDYRGRMREEKGAVYAMQVTDGELKDTEFGSLLEEDERIDVRNKVGDPILVYEDLAIQS